MRQHSGYLANQVIRDFEFAAGLNHWLVDTQAVIQRVMDWTAGQPFLTHRLLQLILHASPPSGPMTAKSTNVWVDHLVLRHCIHRCSDPELLQHLRTIYRSILEDKRNTRLLALYQRVLQQNSAVATTGPAKDLQARLIQTGLVRIEQGRLLVANRLYQEIFDQTWLDRARQALASKPKTAVQPVVSEPAVSAPVVSDWMDNGLPRLAIGSAPNPHGSGSTNTNNRIGIRPPLKPPFKPVAQLPPGPTVKPQARQQIHQQARQQARQQTRQRSSPPAVIPNTIPTSRPSTPPAQPSHSPGPLMSVSPPPVAPASESLTPSPLAPPVRRLGIALVACAVGAVAVLAMTYAGRLGTDAAKDAASDNRLLPTTQSAPASSAAE